MPLSPEDQLRLNVLLAQDVTAIRIDESTMVVHAWSATGEARVPLNPNARTGPYLRRVRELLSTHALGSPGGYPVFLQHWTRMGQHREGQLDKLLLLGEPEAVVAVAGAPGLTPELARRVWWLMPEPDIARRMLERDAVVNSEIGREIAGFLAEHLAFEEDPMTAITSIRLVLQPGLIADEARRRIWSRARHRYLYYKLGFLEAVPDDLPEAGAPLRTAEADILAALAGHGNPLAMLLLRVFTAGGQRYLMTVDELLCQPADKFTAAALLNNIGRYFAGVRHLSTADEHPREWQAAPDRRSAVTGAEARAVIDAAHSLQGAVQALLALSRVDESLATPVLSKTSAAGTLLQRKLEPIIRPIRAALANLRVDPAR